MPIFARRSSKPAAASVQKRPPVADEARLMELGAEMLKKAHAQKAGLLSRAFWSDKLMDWSMKDHEFKVQLFRFVDAFPTLTTPEMVHDHLVDYLTQPGVKAPPGMDLGLRAGGVAKSMMTSTISKQITGMAQRFIAGVDAASALPGLEKLWKNGFAFSVDLLGEACVSSAEADMYRDKYLDLVGNLPASVASWKENPQLERDHLGAIPRVNVSVKVSSLSGMCDPIDTPAAIRDIRSRLDPILELAKQQGVFVNFDMEQFELKDLTLQLFMECCEDIDFHAGLAMQAYLRSGDEDAKRLCDWAKTKNRQVSVRLVKGAYWDYETINAEQEGWPCPVWAEKRDTDACFERMTRTILDAMPRSADQGGVKLALGSHNVRSIAAALAGLEERGLPRESIELQMLHGMADQLKEAARAMDLRLREYVPVGEMIPGMAYLVRRLLENTSNESWLKAGFLDNAAPELLLESPHRDAPAIDSRSSQKPPSDTRSRPPSTASATGAPSSPSPSATSPTKASATTSATPSPARPSRRSPATRPPKTPPRPCASRTNTSRPGATPPSPNAAIVSSSPPTSCANSATPSPPSWSRKPAKPGAKPTPTSAKPSTSASSTPAAPRPCSSANASASSSASSTNTGTNPAASAPSSAPGTSPSPSPAA